jgi:aerobic carbon-monoxide dehydrogenase small subunit
MSWAPDSDGQPAGRTIGLTVNGVDHDVACEDSQLLVEVVREQLRLKGTHVGCLNGDCGACTLMYDGRIVKSCLLLASSCDGADITTIEGFSGGEELDPIQDAFWAVDGFQCGFCLPGPLFATRDLLDKNPSPSEHDIRKALSGNLCRCTGYVNMVKAVQRAAEARREAT